jgi:hypothetical protein
VATVFISHSAREDPVANRYLSAIELALGKGGHEVLLDRTRLQPGDDWNAVIVNWMYVCDVAIVLFSPGAVASPYVLFEISNLVGRLRRESTDAALPRERVVRVCPVLLPGMNIGQIQTTLFGAIKGDLWQAVGPCPEEEACRRILAVMPEVPSDSTPLDDVVGIVADILSDRHPDVLVAAGSAAGLALKVQGPVSEYPKRLARHLLTCRLGSVMAALQKLRPSLGDRVNNILHLVAPSWVSPEAALEFGAMLEIEAAAPAPRCAVINGERADFTPEMYLRRARGVLPDDAGVVIQLNAPTLVNAGAGMLTEMRSALAVELGIDEQGPPVEVENRIAQKIRKLRQFKALPVVVVMLRGSIPDAEFYDLVTSVQSQPFLREVTFVALCGPDAPARETLRERQHVLEPSLREKQEESARTACDFIFGEDVRINKAGVSNSPAGRL